MNYFKAFSIVWGIVMVCFRALIHFVPEKWNHFELGHAYKEKQPRWVWFGAGISLAIVLLTWYKELSSDIPYSMVITLLATATLLKSSQILFNYDNFRKFVVKALVEDRRIINKINIVTTIVGLLLIGLGVFVY